MTWRQDPSETTTSSSQSSLMARAAVPLVVSPLLLFAGHPMPAGIAMAWGMLQLAAALFRPSLARRLDDGMRRIARVAGEAVSWLLLTVMFVLVVVPVGLALRIMRRDSLRLRKLEPGRSAWQPHGPMPTTEQYRRQYLVNHRGDGDGT